MRQTISICDSCGARISKLARTKVSVVATIPHKRVIAEDDCTETVEVDLCCICAGPQLQAMLKALYLPEKQKQWAEGITKQKNVAED